MHLIIIHLLLITILATPVMADEAAVNLAVSRLHQGDNSKMVVSYYPDKSSSAAQFARKIKDEADDRVKLTLINFAVSLEKHGLAEDSKSKRSENTALLNELSEVLVTDDSYTIRRQLAKHLRELYPPSTLTSQRERIRDAAFQAPQRELVLLYGYLENGRGDEIENLIYKMEEVGEADPLTVDSLRGRYGDAGAAGRVTDRLLSLKETNLTMLDRIIDAVAYLADSRVVDALARGMRSEKMVALTGGGAIPLRNCMALSLVKMKRDDPGFPVRKEEYFFSDKELDHIEAWCSRHTGVTYGKGDRKPLNVVPRVTIQ